MSLPLPDRTLVRALVFDVFGTVVDWRGSIVREGEALSAAKGWRVDWPAFADAWRAGYQPAMQRVMQAKASGEAEWIKLDALHRAILDTLLPRFGLDHLAEAEREHLNRVWHRLDPWPDAVAGLTRLKSTAQPTTPHFPSRGFTVTLPIGPRLRLSAGPRVILTRLPSRPLAVGWKPCLRFRARAFRERLVFCASPTRAPRH